MRKILLTFAVALMLVFTSFAFVGCGSDYKEVAIIENDFCVSHEVIANSIISVQIETKGIFSYFNFTVRLHVSDNFIVATKTHNWDKNIDAGAYVITFIASELSAGSPSAVTGVSIEISSGTVSVHKDSYLQSNGDRALTVVNGGIINTQANPYRQ